MPRVSTPLELIRDKRSFVSYMDLHHDDGRLALWCASSSDVQQMLATSRPEQFFMPAYVAQLGWIGVPSTAIWAGMRSRASSGVRTTSWPRR